MLVPMAGRNLRAAIVLFVCLFFTIGALRAQTPTKTKIGAAVTVLDFGSWRAIQKGAEYRKIVLDRSDPNYAVELKLLRFDPKAIAPRILHSGNFQLKSATVQTFAEKSGTIAAINANYFDEKGRPLAYLKTANQEINRIVSRHALYTGVFGLRDGSPFIMHRDAFQPDLASEALQSGPLLLNHGAPVEIMRGLGRFARRAVVGIDREGRVIIGVTDVVLGGLSFSELQELFLNAKAHLDTSDLLNLDGGGSAQLYLKAGKFEDWVAGTTEVPVAIGFFAKVN